MPTIGLGLGLDKVRLGSLLNQNDDLNAHYIETITLLKQSDVTTNPTTEIVPTDTTANVLTLDTTAWGTSKIFCAALKYANGNYATKLITAFDTTTATAIDDFEDDVVLISNVHDASQGQHLSNLGYKALADHIYNYSKRYSYRNEVVKIVNPSELTRVINVEYPNYNLVNAASEVVLPFTMLNFAGGSDGSLSFTMNIVNETLTPYSTSTKSFVISQSGAAGKGIESSFVSDYNGFINIILGSNVAYAGYGNFILLKDNVEVYSTTFKGGAKEFNVPITAGNYKLKVVTATASTSKLHISSILFIKEEVFESDLIFKPTDKILFLMDSWGVFPENALSTVPRYDGSFPGGDCYLPLRFKEKFVAVGGNPDNIILAVRGGQTSVWAAYWLEHLIQTVKPTRIIFNFSINDYGSVGNLPSTASVYDFDPDLIFFPKLSNAGGVFGSCNKAEWKDNLTYLKETCIANKITPIFVLPPRTASLGQTQAGMAVYNNFILGGV